MIEFVRGDSFPFKFLILYKDKTPVPLENIDTLILSARAYKEDDNDERDNPLLFVKSKEDFTFENDYYHGSFTPSDTENLDYGTYYFDIEVTLNSGYRKTLSSSFKITNESTYHKNEER